MADDARLPLSEPPEPDCDEEGERRPLDEERGDEDVERRRARLPLVRDVWQQGRPDDQSGGRRCGGELDPAGRVAERGSIGLKC